MATFPLHHKHKAHDRHSHNRLKKLRLEPPEPLALSNVLP